MKRNQIRKDHPGFISVTRKNLQTVIDGGLTLVSMKPDEAEFFLTIYEDILYLEDHGFYLLSSTVWEDSLEFDIDCDRTGVRPPTQTGSIFWGEKRAILYSVTEDFVKIAIQQERENGRLSATSFTMAWIHEEKHAIPKFVTKNPKNHREILRAVQVVLFLLLADEVEKISVLPGASKRGGKEFGRIINKSREEVVLIDASYYTTTIREEPFEVRGHWRTFKSGSRTWIEGYQKSGYTKSSKR